MIQDVGLQSRPWHSIKLPAGLKSHILKHRARLECFCWGSFFGFDFLRRSTFSTRGGVTHNTAHAITFATINSIITNPLHAKPV